VSQATGSGVLQGLPLLLLTAASAAVLPHLWRDRARERAGLSDRHWSSRGSLPSLRSSASSSS